MKSYYDITLHHFNHGVLRFMTIEETVLIIKHLIYNADLDDAITEGGEGICDFLWENRKNFMLDFSKKYPNAVFEILIDSEHGIEYLKKEYYLNGKFQESFAKVVFEDFLEEKLNAD